MEGVEMTKDDITRMAKEAGFERTKMHKALERFATIVAEEEREACAKVCEAIAQEMYDQGEGPTGYISWVADCHLRIRARGHK
jgi:hypothetical protein